MFKECKIINCETYQNSVPSNYRSFSLRKSGKLVPYCELKRGVLGSNPSGITEEGLAAEAPMAVIGKVAAVAKAGTIAKIAKTTTVTSETGAKLSSNGANLSKHLKQVEKHGQGGFKELQNGRIRYYGNVKTATKAGEMKGARVVKEWNPANGNTRTWYETLDHSNTIRQVHPKYNNLPHFKFDASGKYTGKW